MAAMWLQIDKATFIGDMNGISMSVRRDEDGEWSWLVTPHGVRSESPEVWDFGVTATKKVAMQKALRSAQRADKAYARMSSEGW